MTESFLGTNLSLFYTLVRASQAVLLIAFRPCALFFRSNATPKSQLDVKDLYACPCQPVGIKSGIILKQCFVCLKIRERDVYMYTY